jgi:hypothetical protein
MDGQLTNVEAAGQRVDNLVCADVAVEVEEAPVIGAFLARSQRRRRHDIGQPIAIMWVGGGQWMDGQGDGGWC